MKKIIEKIIHIAKYSFDDNKVIGCIMILFSIDKMITPQSGISLYISTTTGFDIYIFATLLFLCGCVLMLSPKYHSWQYTLLFSVPLYTYMVLSINYSFSNDSGSAYVLIRDVSITLLLNRHGIKDLATHYANIYLGDG